MARALRLPGMIAMTKKLQVYETPEITVSFDPNACKHTGVCLRTLPAVFDIRRSRWVRVEAEAPDQVASAVQKCPSGALQFYRNVARNPAAATQLARRALLHQIAVIANGPGSRDEQAIAICAAIKHARGYDFVALYDVLSEEIAVVGWNGSAPPLHPRFSRTSGLSGAVARSGETQIAAEVTQDERYIPTSAATRSEMVVPVIDPATREVVGTIDVASERSDAFGNEDRELIEDCGREILGLWTEQE
jgi:putative methionine-R-sulfoxide reductase with GAF domain/uncharacterized Fe-S cluster protein YjdI